MHGHCAGDRTGGRGGLERLPAAPRTRLRAQTGPHRIPLASPYTFLSTVGGFVVLLVLLPLELFLDKAPRWDALNDRFGAFYRPVDRRAYHGRDDEGTSLPGILAALIGAAVAFGMHFLKIRYRRPLTPVLAGMATPIASFTEDLLVVLVGFARADRAGGRPHPADARRRARRMAGSASSRAGTCTDSPGDDTRARHATLTRSDSRCILSSD